MINIKDCVVLVSNFNFSIESTVYNVVPNEHFDVRVLNKNLSRIKIYQELDY